MKLLNNTGTSAGCNFRNEVPYFSDYKMHFLHQIWEENGGVSYSPNIVYLARWGGGGVAVGGGMGMEWGLVFFFLFPPLKPRCIL